MAEQQLWEQSSTIRHEYLLFVSALCISTFYLLFVSVFWIYLHSRLSTLPLITEVMVSVVSLRKAKTDGLVLWTLRYIILPYFILATFLPSSRAGASPKGSSFPVNLVLLLYPDKIVYMPGKNLFCYVMNLWGTRLTTDTTNSIKQTQWVRRKVYSEAACEHWSGK